MRLGEVPEDVGVALEGGGPLEGLERVAIVAARLVRVRDRVIGVEARRILGERAEADLEPLVVVAGLLEEEAEHREVLRLVGARGQAAPGDVDAAPIGALRDAVQTDDTHRETVRRVLGGDRLQPAVRAGRVAAPERVDRAHVLPLALVTGGVGQRDGLPGRRVGRLHAIHAPGDVGPRTGRQREARVGGAGRLEGLGRAAPPAQEEIDAALVRAERVGGRRGDREPRRIRQRHGCLPGGSASRNVGSTRLKASG